MLIVFLSYTVVVYSSIADTNELAWLNIQWSVVTWLNDYEIAPVPLNKLYNVMS